VTRERTGLTLGGSGLAGLGDAEAAVEIEGAAAAPAIRTSLVLAGANRVRSAGMADGYLTGEEVRWLDLRGLELVVLSACESGLGASEGGEGLLGLRRSLHQAGCDVVISSLWGVEDRATADLMLELYRGWRAGLPPGEALHRAKLRQLEENRAAGDPRPGSWGAFVVSGQAR
jgi:CHAT domain-containing protein